MSRPLSRFRIAGALSLLAGLALLPSCSSKAPDNAPGDVSRIVYAVRQNTAVAADGTVTIDVAGGMGQVMDYGRYMPGGKLEVFDLKNGDPDYVNHVPNIIEDYPTADVSSVDVSADGTKVVFTMKKDGSDSYHVYWSGVDRGANGKYAVTQLTFGPYDDQNAIFSPGDRIVFTTNQSYTQMGTRADEYNHARAVTQLATITLSGGDADRKLCSQNLSHIVTLFAMHDGRVGFSRWEHLENVNDVKVFAMNPDCTQIVALSGQHGKPGNSMVQVSESYDKNVFYGIVTNRENTIQAGALVKLDARSAAVPGNFDEEKTADEAYTVLTPAVPRGDEPSPIGRYRSPATLPDGRVLVSWADGTVNEANELALTPPDYGVYWYNEASRANQLVVNHPNTWELYAKPITARAEAPIIPSRQDISDASIPTTFGSINIHETSLAARHGDAVSGAQFTSSTPTDVALLQADRVRIIEGFSTEGSPNHTMFGLTMAEGAAILGEAKVEADGSWLADLPPYVPIHLQPIDQFDLSIRSQTTWIQGMPGENRVCGGCHEDRNAPNLPNAQMGGQMNTIAASRGAEKFNKLIADRTEYPWAYANDASNPNEIQALLNAKCVSCHNGTTNGDKPQDFYTVTMSNAVLGTTTDYKVPRMDLTDTPVTVYYDKKVASWPSSYVSLFYPAAMSMEMGKVTVTGTVPPKWAIPSDARNSLLIEKLNVTSVSDATKYAWPLGAAFSDPNVAGGTRTDHAQVAGLTRDELVKLIRSIDMGGQYYARQNSDFKPFTDADPVAAGGKQY